MSTSNKNTGRAVLKRHAKHLREQADRVDTLITLMGRRRVVAFDYDVALASATSSLCEMSKPAIISALTTDDELVSRLLLGQLDLGKKKRKGGKS